MCIVICKFTHICIQESYKTYFHIMFSKILGVSLSLLLCPTIHNNFHMFTTLFFTITL